MKRQIYTEFQRKLESLLEQSKVTCLLIEKNVPYATLVKSIEQFQQQWESLYCNYKLLLELGYESNQKFLAIEKVMKKCKDHKLNDVQPEIKEFVLYIVYFQEISQLLEEEKIGWPKRNKKPFLVDVWTFMLTFLEKISVFYIIRRYIFKEYTKGNYRFVDSWLILHTLLAIAYVIVANIEEVPLWIKYGLLIYGCLRMFEILIYQLNVILVHPYNIANYSLNSYRRMTIALIHNFIEIVFWFAGTFVTLHFITDANVPRAVYMSFTHMVAYSMTIDESKWTVLAIFILQFQAVIGVFMTILSLARFVSLFPQPASKDPLEQEANERRHGHLIMKLEALEQIIIKNAKKNDVNAKNIQSNSEREF